VSDPIDLPAPEHFTAGTVGPPGQRTFFLQAAGEGTLVTLKCEKQQVGALADYLSGMLADLPEPEPSDVHEVELVEPIEPAFVIGSLAVAWDDSADRFLLVVEELTPDDEAAGPGEAEEEDETPFATDPLDELDSDRASVRLRLTREQVASFILTARGLLASGRPPCPICGFPMDPGGHTCPRANGQRRARR
jgi:uncharacterized repeat protein (TIGR03847 family)